jgi:hypothetical protein
MQDSSRPQGRHDMKQVAGFLPLVLFALLLSGSRAGCGPSQPAQDSSDQARLRRIFGIPEGCELVCYDGYPSTVGFGQREGLALSAVYRLDGSQAREFVDRSLSEGWRELPIPEGIRIHIPFQGLTVPLGAMQGIYTCRTAGDNVLYAASTRPVEEAGSVHDILIGIFDSETSLLSVEVRSAY